MKKLGRHDCIAFPAAAYGITALQKMIDFSLDVICSIDEQGNFLSVSAASKKVWGYAPEELAGKPYMDYVVEEDKALTQASGGSDHGWCGHDPFPEPVHPQRRKCGFHCMVGAMGF
jgi:PAS domain-containing protein